MIKSEFYSKIDEYVCKFGGASRFVWKIIDSFGFVFAIVNANTFEVELTNSSDFFKGIKCYNLFKCIKDKRGGKECSIKKVLRRKKRIIVQNDSLEIHVCPIFDSSKKVVSVIIYGFDMSIPQVLRDNDKKYKLLFEQAADSITISDIQTGKFLDFNRSAYDNLGYTKEEFSKLSISDVEEIESLEEVKRHLKEILKKGGDSFESKHRKKNGEIRDVFISTKIIDINGRKCQQSIWKDVTERKKIERGLKLIEERFYNILQNSQDLVYRYNFKEECFDYVSESVFTLLGYTLEEFMKMNKDNYLERIHPEDSKLFQYMGDESEPESASDIEYRFKRKDGEYVWLKGRRIFFRNSNGELTHSIGDFGDVSKEKNIYGEKIRLEEKLRYMRDKSLKSKERASLTEREGLVLWGFCRYPLLNDEELAKKLDIKRSTLTAIKNRLKERKWFSFNYIPNFYKLGFQFFSIFFASFKKGKSKSLEFLKNTPEIILSNYQEDNFLGVFVSDKYVDFKRFLSNLIGLDMLKHGFGEDSFFYNLDNIELYDSSSFINFLFGLKRTKNSHVYKFENGKSELSINEKRVLHEMVKNPEMSSAEIAKNIWVSKPTVIKVKKKLLEGGLCLPLCYSRF